MTDCTPALPANKLQDSCLRCLCYHRLRLFLPLLPTLMKIHIPPFEKARVLVVGDVMLDRYWHGATSRISPEAPVPVVHVGLSEERAGGAANVALNIVALGAQTRLLGVTGDDESAGSLQALLSGAGIDCRSRRLPTRLRLPSCV